MPLRATAIDRHPADSNRRVLYVAIGLVLWMLVVGGRLVQLQLGQPEQLSARARNQQLGAIDTSPTRGQVLDRQGRELARSLDTESFFADPREVLNVNGGSVLCG